MESHLSPTQRLVAFVLSTYMNERGGSCWPSVGSVAAGAGLSRRAVGTAIAALREAGYLFLHVESKGGVSRRSDDGSSTGRTHHYTATIPKSSTGPAELRTSFAVAEGGNCERDDTSTAHQVRTRSSGKTSKERTTLLASSPQPDSASTDAEASTAQVTAAQRLVAIYVEANRRADITPPAKTVGHEARVIKKLLVEGFAEDLIAAAIGLQIGKGLSPAQLDNLLVDVQRKRTTRVPATEGGQHARYTAV